MWRLKVAAASLAAIISLVYYTYATGKPSENLFTTKCRYDTEKLCPDCFPNHASCTDFENKIFIEDEVLTDEFRKEFEQHSIRYNIWFDDIPNVNVNNLNRNRTIENVRHEICAEYESIMKDCGLSNNEIVLYELRKKVGDNEREKGAIMCPRNDQKALARFVQKFDQPELLTLLLMKVNSQSLIVRLGSQHNLPVPSFVFQGGFTLVERFQGIPLSYLFQRSAQQKLEIANEIIKAMIKLNAGVDDFRIYLRKLNADLDPVLDPDDIRVEDLLNPKMQITFTALDNVLIFNDVNKTITGIECPRYSEECDCPWRYGEDSNLFQLCRLFVENKLRKRGRGFLGFLYDIGDTYEKYKPIRDRLSHCLDCKEPDCEKLPELFRQIQEAINNTLTLTTQF